MKVLKSLLCVLAGKRLLIVFGVCYFICAIAIIQRTNKIENDLDIIQAEEITLSRKSRIPSRPANQTILVPSLPRKVKPSVVMDTNKQDVKQITMPPPVPNVQPTKQSKVAAKVIAKEGNKTCNLLPKPTFLQPGKEPLTALHSFPGSGNTWMRVLLSSLTGYNTGDIYKDAAFSKTPGFTFKKDDTVVAIKTHHPFWDDFNGADPSAPHGRYWERVVIVVRHPLDATISGFNFFHTRGSHTKVATLNKYLKSDGKPTKEWNKWAHDQIRNWARCLEYWINIFKGKKLIVFYENLKTDLRKQLLVINKYFGFPLNELRLNCTMESNVQQTFHRNQKVDKRLLYDKSMLDEVEAVLEKVEKLITQNYTHIDIDFAIPPSYAANLVRENFSVKPPV